MKTGILSYREFILSESSKYTKLLKAVMGLRDNIDGIAILTPENPMAKQLTAKENKELTDKFKEEMRKRSLNYTKQIGVYGQAETSYIIYNITRKEAIELGKMFNQESIIYITKGDAKGSGEAAIFEIVMLDGSTPKSASIVRAMETLFGSKGDKVDNYYSKLSDTKYIIKLFDEDEEARAERETSIKYNTGKTDKSYMKA
jgi:hypothetical protein